MNASEIQDRVPLAAFLLSLESQGFRLSVRDHSRVMTALCMGGRWDTERLRLTLAALLAKNPDQKEAFDRAFHAFFDSRPPAGDMDSIDMSEVRKDIKQFIRKTPPPKPRPPWEKLFGRRTAPRVVTPVPRQPNRYPLLVCLLAILAVAVIFKEFFVLPAFRIPGPPAKVAVKPVPVQDGKLVLKTESKPDGRTRIYPARPVISAVLTPVSDRERWKRYAGISVVLLILAVGYSVYLWKYRKPPEDTAPKWHPEKTQYFDAGAIGGKPSPRLDRETLEQLADSTGYFKTSESGKKPDLKASVRATVAKGIPELVWSRRIANRRLILLTDRFAESLEWNTSAGELRRGLERLGVPVLHGRFNGAPDTFFTDDNRTVHLEDLEAGRRGCLLLIFSDGRGIRGSRDRYALESVSRWPMKAWMEPRTEKFWDESTARVAGYGIPVFPATPSGLLRAFRRFLSESACAGPETDVSEAKGPPARGKLPLSAHMENLLGEALPLARAAAMIQPAGFGMIDALRIRFFPGIRPELVERLVALPNTQRSMYGLRFSDPVLRELRTGFAARTGAKEQERIVRFILERIDSEEPEDRESPAHMNWERVRERVRMEIEPDPALKRLAELEKTPLKNAVRADLGKIVTAEKTDAGGIPLLRMPKTRHGLQRLASLAKRSGIPRLKAYPIHPLKWALLGFAWLATAAVGGTAVYQYQMATQIGGALNIAADKPDDSLRADLLITKTGQRRTEASFGISEKQSFPLPLLPTGESYRLMVVSAGGRDMADLGDGSMNAEIRVKIASSEKNCLERVESDGLWIRRCPPGPELTDDKRGYHYRSWKQVLGNAISPRKSTSIGLEALSSEIGDSPVSNLGRMLLETRSVDVLFSVPGPVDSERMKRVLERMILETDFDPNAGSQLVVWESNGAKPPDWALISKYFRGSKAVRANGRQLLNLLVEGGNPILAGDEIRSAITETTAGGKTYADEIVLLRNQWREPLTGMDFVWIPGGRFRMGTPKTESGRDGDEGPVHFVDLDGFWMGKYEVTNAQYRKFKPDHDSGDYKKRDLNGERQPVVRVSWNATQEYLKWMGTNQYEFRLPSEAEWEYACRAGTKTSRFWGDDANEACRYANVHDLTSKKAFDFSWEHHDCTDEYAVSAPVGKFEANRFELHDMLGNVWEWCGDWYESDFYGKANVENPFNNNKGKYRVLRGGSWDDQPNNVRCGLRLRYTPGGRGNLLGFRAVCVFPPSK